MAQVIFGFDPEDKWFVDDPDAVGAELHTVAVDPSNPQNEWICARADGSIAQYNAVIINDSGTMQNLTDARRTAGTSGVKRIGVAQQAFADDEFGWVQVSGIGRVNVNANTAAHTRLTSTTTAGRMNDTTTQNNVIRGITLNHARGAGNGDAECRMLNPHVNEEN